MHHDDAIDESSGKPEIILHYNATKDGVDTCNQMCGMYTVQCSTRRWTSSFLPDDQHWSSKCREAFDIQQDGKNKNSTSQVA